MRVYYGNTITNTDPTNAHVVALANVDVEIRVPGTTTKVAVYASRNPADLTPLPNPIRTGASGYVEFWAEPGDYDIFLHDTIAPARIGDKTIGWAAIPGGDRGIPSTKLANDGGLAFGAMDDAAKRQFVPLGTVLDWWRPSSSYDAGAGAGNPPPGFVVCNGQSIASGQHDMGAGALPVPDLRNKFIIGADHLKADGGQSSLGDSTAAYDAVHPNAPGVRGTGGANAGKDLRHTHTYSHTHVTAMLDHYHGVTGVDHLHGVNVTTGASNSNTAGGVGSGGYASCAYYNHAHSGSGGTGAADRSLYTNTGYSTAGAGGSTSSGPSIASTDNGTLTNPGGVLTPVDMRPAHYGLLKIMKVRRT